MKIPKSLPFLFQTRNQIKFDNCEPTAPLWNRVPHPNTKVKDARRIDNCLFLLNYVFKSPKMVPLKCQWQVDCDHALNMGVNVPIMYKVVQKSLINTKSRRTCNSKFRRCNIACGL